MRWSSFASDPPRTADRSIQGTVARNLHTYVCKISTNVNGAIENSTSLAELVSERPERIELFERLHLDYCCGGSQTLAEACAARGLDARTVAQLLAALEQDQQLGGPTEGRDWSQVSIGELCDHIVSVHHDGLRGELPRIAELLATVVRVHGEGRPELELTERAFTALRNELEPHLIEEEQRLFPACRALEREGSHAAGFELAEVDRHQAEHAEVGSRLAALRELSGGYDREQGLCSTHRALLAALAGFEADLHRHVHEENNILFPRVRELAAGGAPAGPSALPLCCRAWVAETAHAMQRSSGPT
jgi:regulator of cell morphogenesis and NO signaling